MSNTLNSPLMKLALPVATILVVVSIVRARNISWSADMHFVAPTWQSGLSWGGAWIAWIAAAEYLSHSLGVPPPERWQGRSPSTIAVLFVAMVLMAPLAEEMLFRGLAYWRIAKTPAGDAGAIVVAAIFFTVLHLQYGWREWGFILVDGLILGMARWQSRSLGLVIAMHAIGNLLAFMQRVGIGRCS